MHGRRPAGPSSGAMENGARFRLTATMAEGSIGSTPGRHRAWRWTAALVALLLVAGCGGDNSSSNGGEIFGGGRRSNGNGSGNQTNTPAPDAPVVLSAPAGTDLATIQTAADTVRTRLERMHVAVTSLDAHADGVAVVSSADPYQLQAAARRQATTIAPIATTAVGPCNGPGQPSIGPALRCYTLGAALSGVTPITDATAQTASGAGWKVNFSVDPNQYQTFRAPIETAGTQPLALVAGGDVLAAFTAAVPALQSTLGPVLTEEQARAIAAALVVDTDLPIALQPPPLPTPPGARVNQDFWTAALGVNICGTWLANAPPAGLDTGVHSHGDGLVYVHPFQADEAGDHATLGLFLQRGHWKATPDTLHLWDANDHHAGDNCPGGGPATIRWWVDGVEQHGNPSDYQPRNGQLIVISFDNNTNPPGQPPQLASLYLPSLGAAST